ncbi:MAG TPA: SMP-30/gluconolactonase/LRE family protein [Solirubrobacteraceae bacterium]|nr:SMP-30/gluconolactonase/LRE family protein [Solirubrobacteraceae bacterium]
MTTQEVLMTGIGLGESPRWRDGRLWFCDWLGQGIVAVDPSGRSEIVARVASLPFSIDWLPDGTLLVTSGRSLLRVGPDGSLAEHADLSDLSPYGWNEIVVDARGNAFVNSPGFDMMAGAEPAPGIVAVLTPDGPARRVADGVAFPNGMAVTPDDATLIVADSYGRELTAFDIADDGGLSNRRVWADLGAGVPDGICIDAEGAVWYADVPNRRCVRVREGGEVLDVVEVDRGCFACMLGGADGATLFVMAQEWRGAEGIGEGPPTGRVLSVRAPAPHAGRP